MAAPILDSTRVAEAAAALRAGKLVAFPTDTVYGVAAMCDGGALGDNPDSTTLRAFKGGRAEPFSLHCGSVERALGLLGERPAAEIHALRALTPRGLTLVLRWRSRSLGVRVVQHPVGSAFLEAANLPVLATSANLHGSPSLLSAAEIARLPGVDLVLDGGALPQRPASTVARLLPAGIQVLRKGALHGTELASALERTVQFICLGNLNRSAFAAALVDAMQSWLAARLDGFIPAWRVYSSGLIAHAAQRVPPHMVDAAASRGVSLGQHVPARFDAAQASQDLLVAMGDDVAQAVETVARAEYMNLHVEDPMGGPADGYVQAAAHIARGLRQSLLGQWAPQGAADARLESEFEKLFSGP